MDLHYLTKRHLKYFSSDQHFKGNWFILYGYISIFRIFFIKNSLIFNQTANVTKLQCYIPTETGGKIVNLPHSNKTPAVPRYMISFK